MIACGRHSKSHEAVVLIDILRIGHIYLFTLCFVNIVCKTSRIMSVVRETLTLLRKSMLVVPKRFKTTSVKLMYPSHGQPAKVLKLHKETLDSPGSGEVLVRMLAAPINPADINTIQGLYPIQPPLPAIPGNEGVGVIEEVGEDVKTLNNGDMVIPRENAWGTWRSHALCKETELLKVAPGIDAISAATMTVNPCTAYRMLKDFVPLKKGDVVIQNGANSACGQSVIQFCKAWGYISVNIVRARGDFEVLTSFLNDLGADYVLKDSEVSSTLLFKENLPRPKLALNCVGGVHALDILRHLDQKGVMVTYGGMAKEPVTVPTSALIFKDIQIKGFWMTRWSKENSGSAEQTVMMSEIANFIKTKQWKPPLHELKPLDDFEGILTHALRPSGKLNRKFIFDLKNIKALN